jgi:hypothetical protein
MRLRGFPQAPGAGPPWIARGKDGFRGTGRRRAAGALSSPQGNPLRGSDMQRFAQIHTASLQFIERSLVFEE